MIIAAAAHASSVVLKANFFKHFVCLDANDYSALVGSFDSHKREWSPGLLQQLLDQINFCEELAQRLPDLVDVTVNAVLPSSLQA